MNKESYLTSSEGLAWTIIDYMLMVMASSTLAYEIILFVRLPLWDFYPMIAFWLTALFLFRSRTLNTQSHPLKLDKLTVSLLILGVLCFLINILTLRPDADDFSFIHRAVFGLIDLNAPTQINHTAHDLMNLPAISPVHLTTSLEVSAALIAHAFGLQPVSFIHNIIGGLCLFIFPFILYVFFRYLSFSEKRSLLGVVLTIILYIFSGDSHQDWGNFTIVRSWQGKTILTCLIIPLASLLTFRFLWHGNKEDLFRLNLAAIMSIGLSGTAYFLFPFIIAFSVIGCVPFQYSSPDFLRRSLLLSSTSIPFILMVLMIKLGPLPELINTDAWKLKTYGLDDKGNTALFILKRTIFVTKTTFWFYLISTSGIFLLYRDNPKIRAFVASTALVSLAIILPPISSILIKITLPGAYWRLAYATQMPIIIAIFILLTIRGFSIQNMSLKSISRLIYSQSKESRIINKRTKQLSASGQSSFPIVEKITAVFGIFFFLSFLFFKTSSVNSRIISTPQEYKFSHSGIDAIELIKDWIPLKAVVLIPEELVPSIGLIRPDIRMISTRSLETLHVFLNARLGSAGQMRIAAQNDLLVCGQSGNIRKLIAEISTISLFVFPKKCNAEIIQANLGINEENWTIKSTDDFQFWLKNTVH